MIKQQVLYVDMDNTLVDFQSGIDLLPLDVRTAREAREKPDFDDVPGIFALMSPLPDAIESFTVLSAVYDTYILSTAPWNNPSAWSDKLNWVKKYFGNSPTSPAYKRLILTHHKNLNRGAFIVDDRTKRGVDSFDGIHFHFGTPQWPDWKTLTPHLLELARNRD